MTQILGNEKQGQGLVFEIVSARISDESSEQKKHVIYTLLVRYISESADASPSVVERRYTDFAILYNHLKKDHPDLMANIIFPKKVLIGNFDNTLISARSTGFESLLTHIATESKLRISVALLNFLQQSELSKAKQLLANRNFTDALPILENSFRLLNKVFTDRSPGVLIALCRLLGCSLLVQQEKNTPKWANLALNRYEGVSDSDLLQLYVPLLYACRRIFQKEGKTTEVLEQRLRELKRQGIKINEDCSLLDEVNTVEKKIFQS